MSDRWNLAGFTTSLKPHGLSQSETVASIRRLDGTVVREKYVPGLGWTIVQDESAATPMSAHSPKVPLANPPQVSPPPPANVTELQNLLRSIPIAVPGAVITSEYHNALRGAVMALGQALGVTFASPFDVVSLTPSFHTPSGAKSGWSIGPARAQAIGEGSVVTGWQSVSLPDGAVVKSMIVKGQRNSNLKSLDVSLYRYTIGKRDERVELMTSNVTKGEKDSLEDYSHESFPIDALKKNNPQLAQYILPPLALIETIRTDNSKYRYILEATATFTAQSQSPDITIDSIQIRCN